MASGHVVQNLPHQSRKHLPVSGVEHQRCRDQDEARRINLAETGESAAIHDVFDANIEAVLVQKIQIIRAGEQRHVEGIETRTFCGGAIAYPTHKPREIEKLAIDDKINLVLHPSVRR